LELLEDLLKQRPTGAMVRSGSVDGNELETVASSESPKATLGESLVAARKQRGLSLETVAQQTHVPAHYLKMLEGEDYRLISDRLYLLPFLRKYASFLDIDQDETAMRLVREVQRVDNSPSPVRLDEPLNVRRFRHRSWSKLIMFGGLFAVIIGAYIAQSRHSDTDIIPTTKLQSSQADAAAPSAYSSPQTMKALPTTDSGSAVLSGSNSKIPQPATSGSVSETRGTQPSNTAMTGRLARPDQPANVAQHLRPGAGELPSH
jgi:cytoskeletal protein RodZ